MEAKIVVIEKDESIRDLLVLCLETEDWQVFSHASVDIDLGAMAQHCPDLIVLDFDTRDNEQGWGFLQLLKMEDKTAKIPVLITTAAVDLAPEVQGFLLTRYISVIRKPFDLNPFLTLVKKILTQASQAGATFSSELTLPILVVDDTEDFRDTVTTILELEGYPFVTAYNGLVALEAVSRADYCLILLDIDMPIMNGYEFLRAYDLQLRPHIPVIILSGEQNIKSRALPNFVVEVIEKPFDVRHLVRTVNKYAQLVTG